MSIAPLHPSPQVLTWNVPFRCLKTLLQAGHSGRVPAPPEKRFLISM
jgi:hypothetical protein